MSMSYWKENALQGQQVGCCMSKSAEIVESKTRPFTQKVDLVDLGLVQAERKETAQVEGSKFQTRTKIWTSTSRMVRKCSILRSSLHLIWSMCIKGFLESKLKSNYNHLLGLSSTNWGQNIHKTEKLPTSNLDGLCGFLCSLTSTCNRFVVDGPNCHMGNLTTGGSVTSTSDNAWTAYQKAAADDST